ncbi:hypothetical protein [Streptomyces sp. NBC_00503]|uniref:hypothetical protein n=1 Tax=Streptomyces sp. NBC_00503 TaxID=2903659 RepID=UPI002E80C85C|nr:hypothetical protein [Streptomyces sp. NBC_00503]WUD85550.1 hypothetical protein OG490_36145 [Streptomyces sp. NBC_00503]
MLRRHPGRGEFYTFDAHLAERIDTATYPKGVVLVLDGGTWIGMAATSLQAEGHA